MKDKKKTSCFSLSKFTNYEMIMDSMFASSGAHQAKVLEKFEKNNKYIKNQSIVLKFVSALVMMFMPFLSIILYIEITEGIYPSYPIEGQIFLYSFFMWIFLTISILYIFLFGLFTTSSLMSGNAFKWLQTLPISRNDLKKLGFMTLLRNLIAPIIVMTFALPIVLLIVTQSFLTFILCVISSFFITILGVSILIIVAERFSRIFSESNRNSKKANILRIVSLMGFFFVAFGSSFVLQFGMNSIVNLIDDFSTNPPSMDLNILLSFIPLPFAPGYLVGLSLTTEQVPLILWISSLIGMAILAVIAFLFYKVAIKSLNSVATIDYNYAKIKKESKTITKPIEIEIKTMSPVKSYIRKDLISSTRDYQSLIFILMPLLYPIIMIISMQSPITREVSSTFSIMILWAIIMMVSQFIPLMLVGGLLNLEESGSSTLASLPLLPRDQAKGKLILMLIIQGISLILMATLLTILTQSIIVLILFLSCLPIVWMFLLFVFEMKIRLFGTMKYKYVLEEVNKKHKLEKWLLMVGADLAICIFILIIGFTLFVSVGITTSIIALFFIGLVGLSMVVYIFSKMFPKADKLPLFETRGLLRNKPILGGLVVLVLFTIFLNLASLIEIIFLPFLLTLPFVGILFVEFFLIEGFLILLFLLVVPKGLKLPCRDELFSDYIRTIGLTKVKPLGRNLLVGLGSFAIFGIVVWIGANLLGTFYWAPEFLFRDPNPLIPGIASFGWFIWIFMIRPGLWEEVAFRGVILPLLSRKYKQIISILISGVIFGLIHAPNIIFVLLSGLDPLLAVFQVIYATLIGFSMGYMFIKTKSLLPSIIYHYLIDTVGLILMSCYIENMIIVGIYLIVFVGVIPTILNILFIKFLFRKEKKKDLLINK